MDSVRIVFFDAGGTLLRPREDVGEVYARAGRRQGLEVDPEPLLGAFLDVFRRHKMDGRPQDRAWWREIVHATFDRFGDARDREALFDELYAHFTAPASWELFAGARETVTRLQARGYRTGLISNWDGRLPELLDGLDLTEMLDPIVISYRVGVEKPHPQIFETALEEAGVRPDEALMVGDDYEADVEGAKALGMEAVLIRRHAQTGGNGFQIDRLRELLDLLPRA